jgi:Rieske 2Fe-2S family protein
MGTRTASVAELARSLEPLEAARHAAGFVYASPEVFDLEKERLFMKDWLCVAREEEIERPGDYLTHNVMGEPIVLARSADGTIRAFYNMCLHRGVEIAQGSGNTKRFKCPYHAWTYDLEGRLVGAPLMDEANNFDKTACRLRPLRLDTWAGWVFVSFDPEVEPLDRFLDFFRDEFAFLRQEDCRLAHKFVIELDCNWKFVYENLLDIYHVGTTHAATIGRLNKADSYQFRAHPRGRLSIHYEAGTMTPDGQSRVGKMPWLAGYPDTCARIGFLPPNMCLLSRCDYVRPFIHWPISPQKTRSIAYFLFPEEKFDQPGFAADVQVYVDFLSRVLNEDLGMIRSLQRAMASRGFAPGPMSRLEAPIHHVTANYLKRVFADLPA